jgi:hypothetical protein
MPCSQHNTIHTVHTVYMLHVQHSAPNSCGHYQYPTAADATQAAATARVPSTGCRKGAIVENRWQDRWTIVGIQQSVAAEHCSVADIHLQCIVCALYLHI